VKEYNTRTLEGEHFLSSNAADEEHREMIVSVDGERPIVAKVLSGPAQDDPNLPKLNGALLPRSIEGKKTVTWQLRSVASREFGALTKDEITTFCASYTLKYDDVLALSRNLCVVIDLKKPPREMLPEFIKRGEKELDLIEKEARQVLVKLKKLLSYRANMIYAGTPDYPNTVSEARSIRTDLEKACATIEAEVEFL